MRTNINLKSNLSFLAIILLAIFSFSCNKECPQCEEESMVYEILLDIDGNAYDAVTIGTQVWMKQNLKVTKYNDGSDILNLQSANWEGLTDGIYGFYNSSEDNFNEYGGLYNYYATIDSRGLCPDGWHMPSKNEWQTLIDYIGGIKSGGKLKETGTSHWKRPNFGATNEACFSALPGGWTFEPDSISRSLGESGSFWSSTSELETHAFVVYLMYSHPVINSTNLDKYYGLSVRCIKD